MSVKLYFRNDKTTDTWLTPLYLLHKLGEFDLDPCGFAGHPTAKTIFTLPSIDGLKANWHGRVWLNPPYGRECGDWMNKLSEHNKGIALVFARTETKWFQKIIKKASGVLFPSSRVHFLRADGTKASSASAPSCFIAFGEEDALILQNSSIDGWFIKL